ncbi:MAG TPA: hypothetical protein VK783_05055 [Bacteroidia bacterium]|jgi:hypothetical protein|nr:hypothetical protein [Bacteroidia bacterium]
MVAALCKKYTVLLLVALGLVTGLVHASNNTYQHPKDSAKKKSKSVDSNWHYLTDVDAMTSGKIYAAVNNSNEKLQFKFPYNGGSILSFWVRYADNKNLVFLQISKGQFNVNILKATYIRIRFDTAQPEYYQITSMGSGTFDMVLISDPDKIIAKLKKAKKIIVEAPFFNEPDAIVKFDVSGFKWNHKEIEPKKENNDAKASKESSAGGWVYEDEIDKMTSGNIYFAFVHAKDKLDFDFPYDAGAKADICIRNMDSTNDVLLQISDGSFNFNALKDTYVRIRFDDAKPAYYKVFKQDGDIGVKDVFIERSDSLVNKIKTSKKILIEAEFVGNGSKIMEFNIEGLVWNHPERKVVKQNTNTGSAKNQKQGAGNNIFNNTNKTPSVKTTVTYSSYSGPDPKTDSDMNRLINDMHTNIAKTQSSNYSSSSVSVSTGSSENFTLLRTTENIDKQNDRVTLTCTCKNNSNDESTVTLKASFMDADGKVIAVKKVSLSCSGNMQLNTDISASGISNEYKTFKVEVQ